MIMDEPNSWSVGARIKNGGSGGMGIGGKQPMRQQNGDEMTFYDSLEFPQLYAGTWQESAKMGTEA